MGTSIQEATMVTMSELRDGMKVRSSDGHDLGKIIRLDAGMLVIEKGFFFPKDYEVPLSSVREIRGDEVFLSVSKQALTFDEKTVVVPPVREEEVEVTRRPRVRDELRGAGTARPVEQRAAGGKDDDPDR
jgi:hypothetical protein